MKFAVEFAVESTIRIGAEKIVVSTKEGKEYSFLASEDGRLRALSIAVKVDPKKFSSTVQSGTDASKAEIRINADTAVVDELRADFQAIESVFSFLTGALKRVLWNKETTRYIPETEAERASVWISSFGSNLNHGEKWVELDFDRVVGLLDAKAKYASLKVPMAWFREGQNDYEGLRYVEAFNDFYFVIGDFYCDGKTGEKQVLQRMKSSAEFRQTTEWLLQEVRQSGRLSASLRAILSTEGLQLDAEGLMELLVRTRGKTHHYTSEAAGRYPGPFEQSSYESIAWAAFGLAAKAIETRAAVLDRGSSSNAASSG